MAASLLRPGPLAASPRVLGGTPLRQVGVLRGGAPTRRGGPMPQALFGGLFGGSKPDAAASSAAPQYFICVDCGYIYPDGDVRKAPGSYKCPVCRSPKSRFKVYKGAVKGKPNNSSSAMQTRFKARQW